MSKYSRSDVADAALFTNADVHLRLEHGARAEALADLAEIDARRLYLPAGYSSMYALCVERFGLSEQAAYKRIYAGRAARAYPEIFEALASGRLSLSAVVLLSSKLARENAKELLEAAEGKSIAEVKLLLAQWFPQLEELTSVQTMSPAAPCELASERANTSTGQLSSKKVAVSMASEVIPTAPEKYAVRFSIGQEDLQMLEQAKGLLSHRIPSGDEGQVFLHALRTLVRHLEGRKFGAVAKPRKTGPHGSCNPRHVPAQVRRSVSLRDGHRCTFVAENGHRCEARSFLEFDHIVPVARGGGSRVDNLRLRCRAHNQYAAEQVYGAGFMKSKQQEAREAAAKQRAEEVIPWLQALGIRADHARQAAAQCENMADASLQDRVKAALRCFAPRDVQLARATPAT